MVEELPLTHTPDITIWGRLDTDDVTINVAGSPLAEPYPNSVEGIQERLSVLMGLWYLHALDALATIDLLASECSTIIPVGSTEYTAEQEEALVNRIVRKARDQIYGADHSHAVYHFINNKSGESIQVTSSLITSPSTAVHVRNITIRVSDAYIKKELTISETPVSFSGVTTLDIRQTINPVADETWRAAGELFADNGSLEDMGIIRGLFTSELTGGADASHDVETLRARFEANGKIEQLDRILEEVKRQAKAANMNSAFSRANPEMTLPSAAELDEYKMLLSQIRS